MINISNIYAKFDSPDGYVRAVNNINLSIYENDIYRVIGESGSRKSVLGLSILQLLENEADVNGNIHFRGNKLDTQLIVKKLRGKEIGMVMQNPSTFFNSVLTIGYQVAEPLMIHKKIEYKKVIDVAKDL